MEERKIPKEFNVIIENIVTEIQDTFKEIFKKIEDSKPGEKSIKGQTINEYLTSHLFDYYAQIKLVNKIFFEKIISTFQKNQIISDSQNTSFKLKGNNYFEYSDYDKKIAKFLQDVQDGDGTSLASFVSLFKDCSSSLVPSPRAEALNRKSYNHRTKIEASLAKKRSSLKISSSEKLSENERGRLSSLDMNSNIQFVEGKSSEGEKSNNIISKKIKIVLRCSGKAKNQVRY